MAEICVVLRDATGSVQAGVAVSVWTSPAATTLASLYTNRTHTQSQPNPITSGADGIIHCYTGDTSLWYTTPTQTEALPLPVAFENLVGTFNVRDFGAVGDGVTDDTLAIQAAIDAQVTAGRGTVFLPAGVYMVHLVDLDGTIAACLDATDMNNGGICGEGMGATTIKMIADPTYVEAGGGDDILRFVTCNDTFLRDLTVDGNIANSGDEFNGIRTWDCERMYFSNVRVLNHGGTTHECGGFQLGGTFEMRLENCIVDCTKGLNLSGSGFMDNGCWNVTYVGCRATGHTWCGFTTWESAMVSYVGCHSYANWGVGFNCEYGNNITYSSCIAGGKAARYDGSPASKDPYTSNEILGNGMGGFSVTFLGSDCITYNSCQGCNNGKGDMHQNDYAYGLRIGDHVTHVTVAGGCFNNNDFCGILFDGDNADIAANQHRISFDTMIHDNDDAGIYIGKTSALQGGDYGYLTAPNFPASASAVDNSYPFPVMVLINQNGATVSATTINGSWAAGSLLQTFLLQPGGTCEFAYTGGPPGWTWYRA